MKRTRIAKIALACLLMNASTAFAVPVTFDFSATPYSFGYGYPSGGGPIDVPAPFGDFDWVFAAEISGSFTIETDVVGRPAFINLNGTLTEAASGYANPVTEMSLNVGDQHFQFTATAPPGSASPLQSTALVKDLPVPSNQSSTNYDSYNLNVTLGTGIFDGPFSHLAVSFSMVRTERDLSVITSRDMLENLSFSENWSSFFSMNDTALRSSYQIHAPVTSLAQRIAVPEPGTLALFAAAFGFMLLAWRRRAR